MAFAMFWNLGRLHKLDLSRRSVALFDSAFRTSKHLITPGVLLLRSISFTKARYLQTSSQMTINVRRSNDRFHSDHGWLDSYHTFNFAGHYDHRFDGFRSLRVINEDRVDPGEGFPKHPHRDFEIFSYVLSGALEHKDSMGNVEVIPRGAVQFTSAGTGITHSEYNHSKSEPCHFLQLWVQPNVRGLKPSYALKTFPDIEKRGVLRPIVTQDGREGSIVVHNDVNTYASLLSANQTVSHSMKPVRYAYVHVASNGGAISLNGTKLEPGDGAYVQGETSLSFQGLGPREAEFLLFDMA
mmetsp:Transcript_43089/g.69949  ORF Transcript_43089/g.69949 Transcript_43089/m.69949 type:complete len:297 (-) Transcript_43089:25-915(-)|eukprot:CAMPEP_0184656050 /NCGR_PEP_ID=MMETSP0308-20130426/15426_1 /TAXON_ID=38269 /ORGANISM="Gloeochaete witrockiana, Strain SAG 46.84" /LENGTH=296 /DNA_ID=CAMNT_0027092955 /DNA_START=58 /DNA_END=948 /DNA_ORIENTATION=+